MPRASYLENLRAKGLDRAYRDKAKLEQQTRRNADGARINSQRRHNYNLAKLEVPFIGVDGEGGGFDEYGRQLYRLLRVGNEYLFKDNQHLSTLDCLEFLVSQAGRARFVSYAFDYDVTMICRDLNRAEQYRLTHLPFERDKDGRSVPAYTKYGSYSLRYMKRKEFSVWFEDQHIIIDDVFSFFQCPFLKALKDWNIGTAEQLDIIARGKESRADMDLMTDVEIEYNRMECELLAQLMTDFKQVCHGSKMTPRSWQGPGLLAQKLMKSHKVPKNNEYRGFIPPEINDMAQAAYYGGRFEVTRIGKVENVFEYDINSAYPYTMLSLPCLLHTQWHKVDPTADAIRERAIATIRYEHASSLICNYPQRTKSGIIRWPVRGIGTYWGREIIAGLMRQNVVISPLEVWHYETCCDCNPFDYIHEVYAERVRIGKGTKGWALKLALNSQYGKLAQSIGEPQYANAIWAGMITAYTRAMLLDAARQAPDDIVMLATDGVYTTAPLELPQRDKVLGDWEMKLHPEMFIVKPGIYFSSISKLRPKTRGIPMAQVIKNEDKFRSIFYDWLATLNPHEFFANKSRKNKKFPAVEVPMHCFIGLNMALNRKNNDILTLAGRWSEVVKKETYDFMNKRRYLSHTMETLFTQPINPREAAETVPYNRRIGGLPFEVNAPDFGWQTAAHDDEILTVDQPDDFRYMDGNKPLDMIE